jgi:alanyl-tRNA synthetase
MGHEDACLAQVARDFIAIYAPVYTSVADNEAVIIDEISREEEKFQKTLAQGIREFEKLFLKKKTQNVGEITRGSIFAIDKKLEPITVKETSYISAFS